MGRVNTVFKQKLGKQVGCLMAFLWGLTEEEKAQNFNSKAREQGAPIFISPIRAESFQGKKAVPPSGGWSHIHKAPPGLGPGDIFPLKQGHTRISAGGPSPDQLAHNKFIDCWVLQSFSSRGNRIKLHFYFYSLFLLFLSFFSFIFLYFPIPFFVCH